MRTRTSLLHDLRMTRRSDDRRVFRFPIWGTAPLLGALMLVIAGCSSEQWATGSSSTAGSGHTDAEGNCSLMVSSFTPTPTATGYKVSAHVSNRCNTNVSSQIMSVDMDTASAGGPWSSHTTTSPQHAGDFKGSDSLISLDVSATSSASGPTRFRLVIHGGVMINGRSEIKDKTVEETIGPYWASWKYGGGNRVVDTSDERTALVDALYASDFSFYDAISDTDVENLKSALAARDAAGGNAGGDTGAQSVDGVEGDEASADPLDEPAALEEVATSTLRSGAIVDNHTYVVHPKSADGWVTMRNRIHQFYTGALHEGDHLNANWSDALEYTVWGRGNGSYKWCGWMQKDKLQAASINHPNSECQDAYGTSPPAMKVTSFARIVNCNHCNHGTNIAINTGTWAYRNVRPWSDHEPPASRVGWIPKYSDPAHHTRTLVAWRYPTHNGQWVAIQYKGLAGNLNWAYIPRSVLPGARAASPSYALCAPHDSPYQPSGDTRTDWPKVCR